MQLLGIHHLTAITADAPGNLTLNNIGGNVGIGNAAPTQKLDVAGGNIRVAAVGGRGYINIAGGVGQGCVAQPMTQGAVCGGGNYATFSPGLFVEGWTYQNRGGELYAQGLLYIGKVVWAMNPATSTPEWMTLIQDNTTTTAYCCPAL